MAEAPPFGMIWTCGEGDGAGGPPPRFMLETGGNGWNSMFILFLGGLGVSSQSFHLFWGEVSSWSVHSPQQLYSCAVHLMF